MLKLHHAIGCFLFFAASLVFAAPSVIVVLPTCLAKTIQLPYQTLATKNNFQLIALNDDGFNQLLINKNDTKNKCGNFMNVTAAWQKAADNMNKDAFLLNYIRTKKSLGTAHYEIKYQKEVNETLKNFNPERLWSELTYLSSFKDRYANSHLGVEAINHLIDRVKSAAKDNDRDDVSIYTVDTSSYRQPSLVIKVGNSSNPGIVVSGHIDTLSSFFGNKPGADDDASGSSTVLETLRVIFESKKQFKNPIYFMWYAAEEEGLVGSQHVVTHFKRERIPVQAVLHFDLTGYAHQNDLTMWLMEDHTNPALNTFLESLINTYIKRPVKYSRCGYACSDHATWTQQGYPAVIAAEAKYENSNPYMHTSEDTSDKLSLTHMQDYAKLAIAFTVELAEPVK